MRSFLSISTGAGLLAATLPLLATAPAHAQAVRAAPHIEASAETDAVLRNYWTADRLAHAKQLDLRAVGKPTIGHPRPLSAGARQIIHGGLPTAAYDEELALDLPGSVSAPDGHVLPQLIGTSGLAFTTNKLYPVGSLVKSFPYGTVGHLFFTEPSGDYQCSASVIRANVIATAGHCVADGNGTYYSNWVFIPGENGSSKPFGLWTWASADTTSAWWSGGGGVPNEQDDALIVLNTHTVRGVAHRIADYTGYLGYEFNAPTANAVSQLGYPCNLDGCSDPVATYAQVYAGASNTIVWGSASMGGASGGPIIQDFGQAPSGVPAETLGGNIVVASLSYDFTAAGYLVDGASILYAPGQNGEWTFGDLINWACSGTTNC